MLWVAAFLALIIWILGMASDFLGLRIHLFLLIAILCGLVALLPSRTAAEVDEPTPADNAADDNAKSMPADEGEQSLEERESAAMR